MTAAASRRAVCRVLLGSLRARRRTLLGLLGWSLLEAAPAFLSGRLIARALDDGFLAGDTSQGLAWLAALASAVLVGALATRGTIRRLAALVEPFRDELVEATVRGALHRATAAGATADTAAVARLTQQVEIAREAYGSMLLVSQQFVVVTVSALAGLLTLVPVVLVVVLPPLVAGLALFAAALPRMAALQRAAILADERIAEATGTVAGGLRDIAACGAEERARATVEGPIAEAARVTQELARFTAVRTVAIGVGGLLPLALILATGPWLLRHGATTGALVGAIAYVSQGVHPALQTLVRGICNTGLWLVVALARIIETTEGRPAGAPAADVAPAGPPSRGVVRLRGVTFSYGAHAAPIVRELDLDVPEADHIAVVGPSGAGKSTLAAVIAGLLEPAEGEVRLDGVAVAGLDAAALARRRVLIPQEAYVFVGTLGENLSYLRPAIAPEELDAAVERLGMEALVRRLGGYGATVSPGELSAGERQLVALARAYVAPAPLAILDEASCHLDPQAEARVEAAFADRPGTLLVVAHRISSALRARRVLLIDAGDVALGTHAELLGRSGAYRELVGLWEPGTPAADRAGRAATAPLA